jgi:hypothetical protein
MKIIFLDIDGVLNNEEWFASKEFSKGEENYSGFLDHDNPQDQINFWKHYISPILAQRVKDIVEATGAKIVLSSSWRRSNYSIDVLKLFGIECVDMTTRDRGKILTRGEEIQEWLDKHPEVENYIILDDARNMLESQKPFFVFTNRDMGVRERDVKKAIDILNKTK